MKTLDEKLKEIAETLDLIIMSANYKNGQPMIVKLLEALKRCREQRNGWCKTHQAGDGWIEKDDAELLALLEGEKT